MRSQVLRFVRDEPKSSDWTTSELAELYRIQHALVQAKVRLETDRGVSDEGDPWFVFCRADGEILVHIARFDGLYRLYSPGLGNALLGRSFTDLAKSFVNSVPMQVPVQRNTGTKLFVHPAAMLAVVIGTLFFASDDLQLSADSSDDASSHAQHHTGSARHTLHHLQSTFESYINLFLSSIRQVGDVQASGYLALVASVIAFAAEYGAGLSSEVSAFFESHLSSTAVESSDSMPSAPSKAVDADAHKLALLDGNPQPVAAHGASDPERAPPPEQKLALLSQPAQSTESPRADGPGVHDGVSSDKAADMHSFVDDGKGDGSTHAAAISIPTGSTLLVANLPTIAAQSSTDPGSGSNQLFSLLSGGNADIQSLLSHTIKVEGISALPLQVATLLTSALQGSSDSIVAKSADAGAEQLHLSNLDSNSGADLTAPLVSSSGLSTHLTSSDIVPVTSSDIVPANVTQTPAASGTLGMYDQKAQDILEAFLKANPAAEVISDHQNIIVFDGIVYTPAKMVVMSWDLGHDSTITIVGHAADTAIA